MNWLVQAGVSTAIASIVIVIINAVITRRKTNAETGQLSASTTKIITDAASGVVSEIKEDNTRLRAENVQLRTAERLLEARIDVLEEDAREVRREREEWRRVLIVHAAWDALAIAAVREAIPPITLPAVPPLTPPVSARSPLPRVSLSGDSPSEPVGP